MIKIQENELEEILKTYLGIELKRILKEDRGYKNLSLIMSQEIMELIKIKIGDEK